MYQVIIIEDDPMVASINRQYVELNKYLKVTGQFSNGKDALNYFLRTIPQIWLLWMSTCRLWGE